MTPEKETQQAKIAFELMRKEQALIEQMVCSFPEYDFIINAKQLELFMDIAIDEINKIVPSSIFSRGIDADVLSKYLGVFSFKYFSVFSTQLAFESFFYSSSEDLKDSKKFHEVIDIWKGSDCIRFVKAARNRLQHGAFFQASICYDVQIVGEGLLDGSVFLKSDEFWGNLLKNEKKLQLFYQENLESHDDKFLALLIAYREETKKLCGKLETLFGEDFALEVGQRNSLIKEIHDVQEERLKAEALNLTEIAKQYPGIFGLV